MKKAIAIADRLSGPALALVGALNALFLLTFFVVLALAMQTLPARSEAACNGENVIAALKASDPAAYRELERKAAETAYGDTVFFRIENADGQPSWLFGTMHMTDPRVLDLPGYARDAFDASNTVVIETTEILDPDKAAVALFSKPELTMFTDGSRISDFLDDEEKERVKESLAERGIQLALVDRMKPWLLMSMIALPQCELDRKQSGIEILDIKLALEAEEEGKRLAGLETMAEQLDAMASLPIEFHVRGLLDTLALGDRMEDVTETMIQLYEEGRIGMIFPMLRHVSEVAGVGEELEADMADFEEKLINLRNVNMFDRSRAMVDRGGAFIAVGALHLPGEKGLAWLFEDAGYTVTPIH
jgi:uncharacterized protein YbaP (TraB family)